MKPLQSDPFWDGQTGGGVRSSSIGQDASQYHDPSTHFFEGNGGRSIASLLPGGIRGVVLPRATALGGSLGFDPHKPRLVNIDPDIKGQACVVDMSKITKESMAEAFEEASQNPLAQQDIRLRAAQTFHNLAVSFEPVGMGPTKGPRPVDRRAPLGDFSAYVVPRAGLGGGQLAEEAPELPSAPRSLVSPSITPKTPMQPRKRPPIVKQAEQLPELTPITQQEEATEYMVQDDLMLEQPTEVPMSMRMGSMFVDQSKSKPITKKPIKALPMEASVRTQQKQPETKVTFEIEGWGTFEACYHEVIKNDQVLVLVFDSNCKGAMKFFPPATDKIMAVNVEGSDTVYFVHSFNTRFTHSNYEYCLLIIDQNNSMEE